VGTLIEKRKRVARLGALRRYELYGNPGTPEGRSKGGRISTNKMMADPEWGRERGFIIRKEIRYPERSSDLAEFIGIMLGDGGFSGNYQISISYNRKLDTDYACYVCGLIEKLFSVGMFFSMNKSDNGADIVVSGRNVVEFLISQGLKKGNKVRNQVDVPQWINKSRDYRIACLRGLMDTDGGFYLHTYVVNGKIYKYLKICFGNCSRPLLSFVVKTLKGMGLRAYAHGYNVLIYATQDVRRYMSLVGTHNAKHLNKFWDFFYKTDEFYH